MTVTDPVAVALREGPGTMALEEGGRTDFARLRAERLQRCLQEMRREGIDALLLGDEGNARYVAGARRLWLGCTRPYVPGCIVLSDGQIHLMSTWDDGVPAEVPREHLFAASWNPARYAEVLAGIDRLRGARRVGVDAMTPLMETLVTGALPEVELVDGGPTMRRARLLKTADELWCIKTAIAAAESAMSRALDALAPGITERALFGCFAERLGALGLTVPTSHATFYVTSAGANGPEARRHWGSARPIGPGDLVALDGGVLFAGYEGSLARTWPCPGASPTKAEAHRRLHDRAQQVQNALVAACRPGATGGDVLDAYRASGEAVPSLPVLSGLGLGMEHPLVGPGFAPDAGASSVLEPGMVLALQVYVDEEGVGGYVQREVVLVAESGAVVLTRHAKGGHASR